MTYIYSGECTCGACGHTFESAILGSTNTFGGAPDLDLRPPEMMRSTMNFRIHLCPACGYVHSHIGLNAARHRAYVDSEEYRTCEGAPPVEFLAQLFYKFALILLRDGDATRAYDAFLHAAWACDDRGAEAEADAVRCREKAIAIFEQEGSFNRDEDVLRQSDLLRRVGRFDDAIALLDGRRFDNAVHLAIASFQKERCAQKDRRCYRGSDAVAQPPEEP